jgi:hypothetical protein
MDFQGRGIAGATVIGGDYRLGRVHCEEFIYNFEVVGFKEIDFEKFVYGSEEGWSEDFGYFRLSVVLAFEVFDKAREIKYCEQLELAARGPGGQEPR